ncbi:hypothetical protein KIW84_032116 [Lathyrus oleraceus]|uniref:Uncharacterized protein n=1 Tax=Pisum sativum TaxID=3888 RepID=A0A9D4XX52_PEA|nr:hypothetical protein KIW84_032116 [Pisum sativum]
MLLNHDAKLDSSRKFGLTKHMSINVAHATQTPLQHVNQTQSDASSIVQPTIISQFSDSCGGFHGVRLFGCGKGGKFGGKFKVQYQICFKTGHDVNICYHRHSSMMPPLMSTPWNNTAPTHIPAWNQWTNSNIPQYMASTNQNQWLVPQCIPATDSGATHYITNNADFLTKSSTLPGTDQALLENGQGLPITSIGSACFACPHTTHTYLTLWQSTLFLMPLLMFLVPLHLQVILLILCGIIDWGIPIMKLLSENSCNLEVVDEVEAQHRPAGIDLCPGYLLQVVSRFDLDQVASLFQLGVFLCRYKPLQPESLTIVCFGASRFSIDYDVAVFNGCKNVGNVVGWRYNERPNITSSFLAVELTCEKRLNPLEFLSIRKGYGFLDVGSVVVFDTLLRHSLGSNAEWLVAHDVGSVLVQMRLGDCGFMTLGLCNAWNLSYDLICSFDMLLDNSACVWLLGHEHMKDDVGTNGLQHDIEIESNLSYGIGLTLKLV